MILYTYGRFPPREEEIAFPEELVSPVDNPRYFATRSQTPVSLALGIAYCTSTGRRLLLANRLLLRIAIAFLARIPYL